MKAQTTKIARQDAPRLRPFPGRDGRVIKASKACLTLGEGAGSAGFRLAAGFAYARGEG